MSFKNLLISKMTAINKNPNFFKETCSMLFDCVLEKPSFLALLFCFVIFSILYIIADRNKQNCVSKFILSSILLTVCRIRIRLFFFFCRERQTKNLVLVIVMSNFSLQLRDLTSDLYYKVLF